MTLAMSLLVHGEAVRFNRGQARGDDYDFKYMKGRDGKEYPYVSSQCFKKYWREALSMPFSPIIRERGPGGKEKNQAYTSGNPIEYVDDDLFGYMIAGATEEEDDTEAVEGGAPRVFELENLKNPEALRSKLLDESQLSKFILGTVAKAEETLQDASLTTGDLIEALLNLLDEAARKKDLATIAGTKKTRQNETTLQKRSVTIDEIVKVNREILLKTLSKELQEKPKLDTTKRTAPVRMHALVGFSGIKTARDFQTFSRDIAYSGLNSIMNPAPPGIYSAWLKTRILIESHRIGKFYVGKNMDILKDRAADRHIRTERNPYSRTGETVECLELNEEEKIRRFRAAIRALADIGNRQGPASGALHDGSLRPKAFVAGMMTCADSPFDYIWSARSDDEMPDLNPSRLIESLEDWKDLFATRKIYIGLPSVSEPKETIETDLKKIGFEAVIDTPRKALLTLAEQATV